MSRFVHDFDPVLATIGPVRLYYYGLAYTLGFIGLHLWLSRLGPERGWSRRQVYDFSIIVSLCVLLFGRAFEIVVYEWEYIRANLDRLLSYWNGGMASHGVLLGALIGIAIFSRIERRRFLEVADEVAIPAAFFLAVGRVGNFINGEIVGTVTAVPWGVKFPTTEGFRHPVALYESLKNLALIPILWAVRRRVRIGDGKLTAHFVLWYGLLRLLTDHFREYGTSVAGIGTGQYFNLLMALAGLGLLVGLPRLARNERRAIAARGEQPSGLRWRRALLAAILVFYLGIPGSWSRGSLEFYRGQDQSSAPASRSWTALPNR